MDNNIGNKIKEIIVFLLKKLVKLVLVSVLPVFLTIVVLAILYFIVDKNVVQKVKDVILGDGSNSITYKTVVYEDERVYKFDEDIIDKISKGVENNSIDNIKLGLTKDLLVDFIRADVITTLPDLRSRDKIWTSYTGDDVQGCIKFVRKFDDGSSITMEYLPFKQYQELIAKFGYKLKDSEGNTIEIDSSAVYNTKSEIETNYPTLRGYFTLDSDKRLVISKLTTIEEKKEYNSYAKEEGMADSESFTYYVSAETIDYQLELSKKAYSMPMEFLVSVLGSVENSGFCKEMAKLALDSKIEISIFDHAKEIVTDSKEDYSSDFYLKKTIDYSYEEVVETPAENTDTNTEVINTNTEVTKTVNKAKNKDEDEIKIVGEDEGGGGGQSQTPETTEEVPQTVKKNDSKSIYASIQKGINMSDPYCTTHRVLNETSNSLCVTLAETWFMDVMADVSLTESVTTTSDSDSDGEANEASRGQYLSSEITDLSGYTLVTDYHHLLDKLTFTDIPTDAEITNQTEEVYEKRGETHYTTDITTTTKTLAIVSKIELKEEKFLSLLRVNPNTNVFDKTDRSVNTKILEYTHYTGEKFRAEDTLLVGAEMLFDCLKVSQRVQAYEEIMRYLFYVYSGTNYGFTSLTFSEYEPSEFTSISPTVFSGSSFEYKIWMTLKNAGFSDEAIAGAMGNFQQECSFHAYCLEDYDGKSNQKELCEKFIADVDSGVISREEFINNYKGFGLVQWTYHTRKGAFYDFVKSIEGGSIGSEELQIEFLMAELGYPLAGSTASNFTGACIMTNNSFTDPYDAISYGPHTLADWTDAQTPEDAAEAFDTIYESGSGVALRKKYARELYEKYKNMTTGGMILYRMGDNGVSKDNGLIIARFQAPTGKVFTTFNQGGGTGGIGGVFQTGCNRAAQISVCSAYYYEQGKSDEYIIQRGKDAPDKTCPGWRTMYDECGLEAWTTWEHNNMQPQPTPEQIREVLTRGGYLIFCVKGNKDDFGTGDSSSKVLSKYGHAWAGTQHYIAILAYRMTDQGEEIYVSSSSRCDHKDESTIMTGWHPIDEFTYASHKGKEVKNYVKSVTEIYEKSLNASPIIVTNGSKV